VFVSSSLAVVVVRLCMLSMGKEVKMTRIACRNFIFKALSCVRDFMERLSFPIHF